MTTARAYWTVAEGRGELRSEELPAPRAGEVCVRALHGAVSRGTELLVHYGQVPESEYARMRAPHQQGGFPWPVKYGYSSVGTVIAGPPELEGRQTFCLYPHQDAYVVGAAALFVLPANVPPARAVLAANMETALNAIWDAALKAGDRVAVIGGGAVGVLVAYLAARHPGTQVELIDVDARKRDLSDALGIAFALPEHAHKAADVVFHASGSPAGLRTALELAGRESTVLELSWYGKQSVSLDLGAAFHAQRLSIRSSQVGGLPPAQAPRWSPRRRLELALSLLCDERLDRLIDAHVPFSELPLALRQLANGERTATCLRVDY